MAVLAQNTPGYSRVQQTQDEFDLTSAGIKSHGWDSQALAEQLRGTGSFAEQRTNAQDAAEQRQRIEAAGGTGETGGSQTPAAGAAPGGASAPTAGLGGAIAQAAPSSGGVAGQAMQGLQAAAPQGDMPIQAPAISLRQGIGTRNPPSLESMLAGLRKVY